MSSRREGLKSKDDRDEPGRAERVAMVVSVVLTVTLFGYTAYMGITAPDVADVSVQVVRTEQKEGGVHVHLEVSNDGSKGFSQVTVAVRCDDPAPRVTVANLPASGKKPAIVVCPPGTEDPEVQLVSMIPP